MTRHTRKSRSTKASKNREPNAIKMAGKKKANMISKSNLRLNRTQEERDHEAQEETLSSHQQQLASPSNNARVYYSPDDVQATALEKRDLNTKGKWRADLREGMSHNLSTYQPNYQEVPMNDQQQSMQASTSSHVQYSPPKISPDQPRGSFFDGPTDKVEINGGTLNHTLGHQTNVTIQVNPPREERYDIPHQHPHLPALSPRWQIQNPDALPPPQDIQDNHFPPITAYRVSPSMLTSESTTIYSPENSNKIYERHLERKQRGFPLWIPEPNRTSPMPYRRKGVDIGDVGVIMPSGGFLFLFNICRPHDDPSNPRTLPDNFVPIQINSADIYENSEFKPESYLASKSVEKTDNEPSFHGLSFSTSAAEGAILTLPDGAISRVLVNSRQFLAYATANVVKSWYRYVNGTRGYEAKNGDIRLVTGCVKATSWGMAVIANMTQHKVHHLKYRSIDDVAATAAPIPLYKWEYTGFAEARVGPDLSEIKDLKRDDHSEVAVEGKYWNQCLFINTMNISLSDENFAMISRELESTLIGESQHLQHRGGSSTSTLPNVVVRMVNTDQQQGTNSATQTGSSSESSSSAAKTLAVGNVVGDGVIVTTSQSISISHPADVLNTILLKKVPNCQVVITRDEDWCSVITEDDEIMPSPSEIAERVLATHHIRKEDGVVFLEPKKLQLVIPPRQISSRQFVEDHTDSQKHMAPSSKTIDNSTSSALPDLGLASLASLASLTLNLQSSLDGPSVIGPAIYGQYLNGPYQFSNEQSSNAGQGIIGASRGSQSYASATLQFMPMQPLMACHSSSPDTYMTPIDGMEYINYPDDSPSPTSSPAVSFDARRHRQESPQPTAQETEAYLRKSLSIPATHAVNLYSLPDDTKPPKISDMVKLAIWGSPDHKLTLRQIYEAIENRYPGFKDAHDKPWQRSIRHNLSLKAMFVREERPESNPGKGYYWTLNVRMGEGNKRDRKRKDRRDDVNVTDEDDDIDFSSESQGYLDTTPSPSMSPPRQQQYFDIPQIIVHSQSQYISQPSHGMPFDQSAGHPFYNAHQNTPFQMGRTSPSLPQTNPPQWASPSLNPQMDSMPHASAPGIPAYGLPYQQQEVGSSHHRNPTGGTGTRSRKQTDRLPQILMPIPIQGGPMFPMTEGVSYSSSRSLRRSHSDTSPEDDDDERARSAPRQRSGHRS